METLGRSSYTGWVKLSGRVLWLTDDHAALQKQLEDGDTPAEANKDSALHYGVNTDAMINGAVPCGGQIGDATEVWCPDAAAP